jgi:phospholipid/cholesterol/gamma-HCH transport system substrate-binding protein
LKLNNETKVGILAAVAITLLILGFNMLKGEKIFVSGFELKSYYNDIAGLSPGNPVIYNGFRVGQVKGISIDPKSGNIEVRFSLKKGLQIPYDSDAVIANADLLGSKAVRIERGKSKENVENGGVLNGTVEPSLETQIKTEILPLKDDIGGLIQSLNRFVGWLNNTMDESTGNKLDNILDEFVVSSRNLARTSYRVDTLLGTFQATAGNANKFIKNLNQQNETIERIMNNTAQFTDSLAAASGSVKDIMDQSSEVIKNLEGILADVESGKGSLGKLVSDDELYNNINSSSARLDSLLSKFQNSPRVPIDLKIRLGDPEGRAERRREKQAAKLRRKNKGEK